MKIGLIIDPLDELQIAMDTSLLMIAKARQRRHTTYIATLDDLYGKNGCAGAAWREVVYDSPSVPPHASPPQQACLDEFDLIVMRKDPPVDEAYLAACFILEATRTPVINSPSGLRLYNEKIGHWGWEGLAPPTLVSRNTQDILDFVKAQPQGAVAKPLNLYSGKGVFRLKTGKQELEPAIAKATENNRKFIVVQRYLEAVRKGDKRVYLVDGKPIGWMNRRPAPNEWRANIHLGAKPEPVDLSDRDREIIAAVGEGLQPYDLPLACIDIIGDYLTEVNVTSPSGLPEINQVQGKALEGHILEYLETRMTPV